MCYQIIEIYSACRCIYYEHAVDKCASFSRPNHEVAKRTILVGYACANHARASLGSTSAPSPIGDGQKSTGKTVEKNNRTSHKKIKTNRKRETIGEGSRTRKAKRKVEKSEPEPEPEPEDVQHEISSTAPSIEHNNTSETHRAAHDQAKTIHSRATEIPKSVEVIAEDSESDISTDSRSIISQASTATTVDEDALGALFRGLLNHPGLRHLWPQIIAGQASREDGRQTIDRFLRRFAEDLERLADKSYGTGDVELYRIVLSSSRFVKRYRVEIAWRICQSHETKHQSLDSNTANDDTGILAAEEAADHDADPFIFSVAEEFIFETEPILYLEANVVAFVRQRQQKQFSRAATTLRSYISLTIQHFNQAPLAAGKRRISWKCICGCQITDDYDEQHEGAIQNFEDGLKGYNQATPSAQQQNNTNWKSTMSTTKEWFRKSLTEAKSHGSSNRLPSYRQGASNLSTQLGACARSASISQAYHNFVLLCIPYLRWGLRLHNTEVCRIDSDQQYFKLLRQCYLGQRRGSVWKALRRFRKVRALQFVKFEVFRNTLVDVRVCPSMPTTNNDYAYDPMPPEVVPPIGPNLLMHLFENPDHADVTLFLFRRFPKKLRTQLEACPVKGSSIGWGVEFVEGIDWYAVFVTGCIGFLFCLIFGVAWSVAKGDVQGGFGIASFLLAFVVSCGGILHYMI
ncbi:hypothetical protein F4808DRAFT_263070 [Astrocystis sublimbata]|nr:hypothetical protein F4808DRAFT_263070 [Astrocystis sublimbata]